MRSATEQAIISAGAKMTAGGSVTAVGSGVTGQAIMRAAENPDVFSPAIALADIGVMFGIGIGLMGFAVQGFATYARHKREKRLYEAQLAALMKELQ